MDLPKERELFEKRLNRLIEDTDLTERMEDQYYFTLDDAGKPLAVFRFRIDGDDSIPEKWQGGEWVLWPSLIRASGIGGDNHFQETTKKEALAFKVIPLSRA